jgi:MoaA/NifB/PqqE/SkfB family radical SAM enzyme
MLRVSEFIRKALSEEPYRPFPGVILIWNLTNRCNLYCKHCYSSANQETEGELSLEEIESIAEDLAREDVRFAILSGGEPLLRKDIYDISRILKDRGIKTYLSTNGLLINRENVKRIG